MKSYKGFIPIQNEELKMIRGGVDPPPQPCSADCPDGSELRTSDGCTSCGSVASPPKVECYAPFTETKVCKVA